VGLYLLVLGNAEGITRSRAWLDGKVSYLWADYLRIGSVVPHHMMGRKEESMAQITDEAVHEIKRRLNDFGYAVDFEYCRKAVDDWREGKPNTSGAPSVFIEKMLRDSNLLPES